MIHVVGNHEADDSGSGAIAARSVFGVPAAWYSVERGDVYIAVLNHTSDKDTIQQFTQWLVEDAAKSTCTWKVLVTHVPAYYTNPTGGGETYVQYLPAACDAAGIDFYFSGNDHSYARTAPMTGGQVDENGTVYYICGSTGGKSYSIVNNPDFHFDVATLNFDSVYVDVTADRFQATVTAYNVATDGTKTVLDQYTRRAVPVCKNDEHTYLFDLDTKELFCDVCGHTENAVDEKFSGFVREQESRRLMYLVAGVPLTGHMHYEDRFYFADDQGYAYDGAYNICGETCLFEGGFFTRSTTADVRAAGPFRYECGLHPLWRRSVQVHGHRRKLSPVPGLEQPMVQLPQLCQEAVCGQRHHESGPLVRLFQPEPDGGHLRRGQPDHPDRPERLCPLLQPPDASAAGDRDLYRLRCLHGLHVAEGALSAGRRQRHYAQCLHPGHRPGAERGIRQLCQGLGCVPRHRLHGA